MRPRKGPPQRDIRLAKRPNKGLCGFRSRRALSARETQRPCLREPRAACSAADAAGRLRNGLRRVAAVHDSMLELLAVGEPRADSHAVTGVVSRLRPQAGRAGATEPACVVDCARSRDMTLRLRGCCGDGSCGRPLEGLIQPLCTRSLSRVLCIGRSARVVPVPRTCSGVRGRIRNVVFSHLSAALLVRPTWCRMSRCESSAARVAAARSTRRW